MCAGQWLESKLSYEKIQKIFGKNFENLTEPSRSKVRLSWALVLIKLNYLDESKGILSLIEKDHLKNSIPADQYRRLSYEPKELGAHLYGFLAQVTQGEERRRVLTNRLKNLDSSDIVSVVQTLNQLSEEWMSVNSVKSKEYIDEAMKQARILGEDQGNLNQALFRTMSNYMIHAILFKADKQDFSDLNIQLEKTLTTMRKNNKEGVTTFVLKKEEWWLQGLWNCFEVNVLGKTLPSNWLEHYLDSPLSLEIKEGDLKFYTEMKEYFKIILKGP